MTHLRRAAFERALARLDRAALAAFVADLWTARGWEIERRGDAVVATDPATRDRRVLFVASPGWRAVVEQPPPDADAVVAVRRGPPLSDAERIDPTRLYELARYAVDAEDRERLLREHFGGVPSRTPAERVAALVGCARGHRKNAAFAIVVVGVILGAQLVAFTGAPAADAGSVAPGTPTAARDDRASARWLTERLDLGRAAVDRDAGLSGSATIDARTGGRYPVLGGPVVVEDLVLVGRYDGSVAAHRGAGLEPAWRIDLPGHVVASAVVGETVYVIATGDGATLHALSAADGTVRWARTIDGVRSTPAVARDAVYVGSVDGRLHALDADTGERRWSRTIGGMESSPVVANGTIYVGSTDGRLHAIDADTGATRWTLVLAEGVALTAPTVAGDAVYVGAREGGLYAVSRSRGAERWRVGIDDRPASAPVVAGETVFVANAAGSVHAVDADTGKIRWVERVNSRVDAALVVVGDTVYVGSGGGNAYSSTSAGRFHALDARTGAERWNVTTRGPIVTAPAVGDDALYAGDAYGWLYRVVGGNATA